MAFLKKMFSGGNKGPVDNGIYVYVKLDRSGEVVSLRLDPQHELNADLDAGGYFSKKHIVGPVSYARAVATFYFDQSKALTSSSIDGGSLSDKETYDAQFTSVGDETEDSA